jgi:hypothetical protein
MILKYFEKNEWSKLCKKVKHQIFDDGESIFKGHIGDGLKVYLKDILVMV